MRWGLCPHTPGIYRFGARMTGGGGLLPPRHSGPESALGSHPCVALSSPQALQLYDEWARVCYQKYIAIRLTLRYKFCSPERLSYGRF